MNDLIALATSGNTPLFLAAAVGAVYYLFLRKPESTSGNALSGWLSANKLTLFSVATTLFQHRDLLAGFVATFLSNIKSLFVKPEDALPKK